MWRPLVVARIACVLACVLAAPPVDARSVEHARPKRELPVLLVPGFLGFRSLGAFGSYWRGWREALEADGYEVFEMAPTPVATSDERAAELVHTIASVKRRTGADRVLVVAHSQGGVDVRHALALTDDIAAVATLSSPHEGTEVADVTMRHIPRSLVVGSMSVLQRVWQTEDHARFSKARAAPAIGALSTTSMARWTAAHDAANVPFYSFAAVAGGDVDGSCRGGVWAPPSHDVPLTPALIFGHTMIQSAGRVSDDGVVPTRSMRFGTFVGCVPGEHAVWLGWDPLHRFDQRAFARALVRTLDDAAHDRTASVAMDLARMEKLAR